MFVNSLILALCWRKLWNNAFQLVLELLEEPFGICGEILAQLLAFDVRRFAISIDDLAESSFADTQHSREKALAAKAKK